jgi:NitT/TauT family transport system permease protein
MGFGIGRLRFVAEALEPANDFLRYLPVAGFSSLTIFLLGTGDASATLVVFIGTVFHLVVATADVVRRVPPAYLDLGRTMSYGAIRRLRRIIIPATSPAVFDNLRIAVGWAWSYVTLAEIMGAEGGLGHAIEVSRRYIRTDQVLLWIAIVGILGLMSDQAMRAFGRRWFRWAA